MVEPLERFEFSIPLEEPVIVRVPAGTIMIPFIRDKMHLGPTTPLQVTPVQADDV